MEDQAAATKPAHHITPTTVGMVFVSCSTMCGIVIWLYVSFASPKDVESNEQRVTRVVEYVRRIETGLKADMANQAAISAREVDTVRKEQADAKVEYRAGVERLSGEIGEVRKILLDLSVRLPKQTTRAAVE